MCSSPPASRVLNCFHSPPPLIISNTSSSPWAFASSWFIFTELKPQGACPLYFKDLSRGRLQGLFNERVIRWKEASLWGTLWSATNPIQKAELNCSGDTVACSLGPSSCLHTGSGGISEELREELKGVT